jgi:hypothetical protein
MSTDAEGDPPMIERLVQAVWKLVLALIALRIAIALIQPVLPWLLVLVAIAVIMRWLITRHR